MAIQSRFGATPGSAVQGGDQASVVLERSDAAMTRQQGGATVGLQYLFAGPGYIGTSIGVYRQEPRRIDTALAPAYQLWFMQWLYQSEA